MRHDVLLQQLRDVGVEDADHRVVGEYLAYPDLCGTGRGMVASGGLSPLLGGLYLAPLDRAMEQRKAKGQVVEYVRYMDDIVFVTVTRWQLRRAIAALHGVLRPLGLRLHRVRADIDPPAPGQAADIAPFLHQRFCSGARGLGTA